MKPLETKTLSQFFYDYPEEGVLNRKWPFSGFDESDEIVIELKSDGDVLITVHTKNRTGEIYASCSVLCLERSARVVTPGTFSLSSGQAIAYASLVEDCARFCARIEAEYAKYVAGVERERKRRIEAVEQDPLVQMLIDRANYASVQVDGYLVEIRSGALSIKPVPTYEDENEEAEED